MSMTHPYSSHLPGLRSESYAKQHRAWCWATCQLGCQPMANAVTHNKQIRDTTSCNDGEKPAWNRKNKQAGSRSTQQKDLNPQPLESEATVTVTEPPHHQEHPPKVHPSNAKCLSSLMHSVDIFSTGYSNYFKNLVNHQILILTVDSSPSGIKRSGCWSCTKGMAILKNVILLILT